MLLSLIPWLQNRVMIISDTSLVVGLANLWTDALTPPSQVDSQLFLTSLPASLQTPQAWRQQLL